MILAAAYWSRRRVAPADRAGGCPGLPAAHSWDTRDTMTARSDRPSPPDGNGGHRRVRGRHVAAMCGFVVPLAALAFFLTPTDHANYTDVVQINGINFSVPAGTSVSEVARLSALVARDGSRLDVTGDVVALGGGSPAGRQVDGRSFDDVDRVRDGSQILVRHGKPVLEAIRKTGEEIPFETVYTGEGNIVSFVQTGAPGQRDIYLGVSSGKQAASLVVIATQNTVYRLDSTPQPGQKLAALTFDDGPGTHTQEMLDILVARHVPATFFVLGSTAAAYPELIEKEKAAGCEVENHSWSHPWFTELTDEEIISQISRTDRVIGGSKFLRPPYGDWNSHVRALAASMGLKLAFWTVDTRDWELQDVDAIMSHVKAEVGPDAIILMHDGGKNRLQTVAAIPVMIDWLFEQGYSLTVVDQIL
jgi:peptidoglycan/xylan/chitin deacetylase (PgdA/CDA1 family)